MLKLSNFIVIEKYIPTSKTKGKQEIGLDIYTQRGNARMIIGIWNKLVFQKRVIKEKDILMIGVQFLIFEMFFGIKSIDYSN